MAILVTGGAGYIGSHTVIELLKHDQEVIIVDNYYNAKPEVLDRIKEISQKDFKFYECDVLDQDALQSVFDENDIEAVIHFAAYKAVGESVLQPLKYYHNNIEGTVSLLKVMEKNEVKNLVYSSSATVYGETNPVPFHEELPADTASNPYGYTKVVCEHLLKDLAAADPAWSIVILRYFNPIGAHESGLIGEDPQGIPNNLMPYVTQVAVGKLDKLSIYGDDYDTHDGTGVRDYIHVVDLAKGHVSALVKAQRLKGVGIYNLGTGEGYSVLDLVKAFQSATGVEIPYEIVDRRPGDIDNSYADVSKARNELGWEAQKTLEDMCRDSWRWQEKNPKGYSPI